MEEKKESKNKEDKISTGTIFRAILIIFLAVVIFFSIFSYFIPLTSKLAENKIVEKTLRHWPLPATIVGKDLISMAQLDGRLLAVINFYENQDFSKLGFRVDFSTEDGKKRLQLKPGLRPKRLLQKRRNWKGRQS